MQKKLNHKKAPTREKKPAGKKAAASAPAYRPFEKLSKHALTKARAPVEKQTKPPTHPIEVEIPALEEEAFESHMRGVRPLEPRAKRVSRSNPSVDAPRRTGLRTANEPAAFDKDSPARERLHALVTDALRFEVTDDGTTLEGRRIDVDPRELRRLRTMRHATDGKLDLHGLTVAEARSAVVRFLSKRAGEGDRAVLVIHGKGKHSPRGDAVLRGELGAWLSQASLGRHVLAFASVVDQAGESGSVFVLLTR